MFSSKIFRQLFLLVLGVAVLNVFGLYLLAMPQIREVSRQSAREASQGVLSSMDEMISVLSQDLAAYRDGAYAARRARLRDMVRIAVTILDIHRQAGLDRLDPDSPAGKAILDEITGLRFGQAGTVFVSDSNGRLMAHPNASYAGTSPVDVANLDTRNALERAVKETMKHGESEAGYDLKALDPAKLMRRAGYFRRYAPWGLIVGASFSLDEVDESAENRKKAMIAGLGRALGRIGVSGQASAFILDGQGGCVVAPRAPEFSSPDARNLATNRPLLPDLVRAAGAAESELPFKVTDSGGKTREGVFWTRKNADFDWILVYGADEGLLRSAASSLGERLALFGAALLILSGLAAWWAARRLVSPIKDLSGAAGRLRDGDLSARCPENWTGEYGLLALAFNEMAAKVQSLVGDLDGEVRERTSELDRKNVRLNLQIAERKRVEEELLRSQSELRGAMSRAEAASRAKTAFLADMSHEIRTPMNAIIGMSGLALAGPLPAAQRERLEIIRSAAADLLGIVDGVLDLSKIEAGKAELDERPFDLRRLLGETAGLFGEQALSKGIELVLDVDADVPGWVFGDAGKLKQILANLMANALRFTDRGSVALSVKNAPAASEDAKAGDLGGLSFSVADTGPGIAPEDMDGIFEAFSQAGPGSGAKRGGTGLGLAISKRLAAIMGGRLDARSEQGRGSVFTLAAAMPAVAGDVGRLNELRKETAGKRALAAAGSAVQTGALAKELFRLGFTPVEAAGRDALREVLRREEPFDFAAIEASLFSPGPGEKRDAGAIAQSLQGAGVVLIGGGRGDGAGAAAFPGSIRLAKPVMPASLMEAALRLHAKEPEHADPHAVGASARALAGASVLLVEDIEVNRQVALEILRMVGIEADVAVDGLEAVKAAVRKRYDAILMDLQMPNMNGFEAAAAIRSLPGCEDVPIVAMTAYAFEGENQRRLEAGMDDYVGKPVEMRVLLRTLERWIVGREGTEEGASAQAGPVEPGPSLSGPKSVEVEESGDPGDPGDPRDPRDPRDPGEQGEQGEQGGNQSGPVDFADGLERLGGDHGIHARILGLFASTFAQQIEKASRDLENGELEQARVKIHSLAGAAGNISARELRLSCKRLEALILERLDNPGDSNDPDQPGVPDRERQELLLEAGERLAETLEAIRAYAPAAGGERAGSGSGAGSASGTASDSV